MASNTAQHEVESLLRPIIEPAGPPFVGPKRQPKMRYDFGVLDAGGPPARFNKSAGTVKNKLYAYYATPEGKGKKFIVRPITPTMCRIWRIK